MKLKNSTSKKLKINLISGNPVGDPDVATEELMPGETKETNDFPADLIQIEE